MPVTYTTVSFYSYQGRRYVVNKSLSQTPNHTKQIHFITGSMPQLTMDIELDARLTDNYCTWTDETGRVVKWFIESIEAYKDIYIYHLSLDVLETYWNDIKSSSQVIERSSNLTPTSDMHDTLWKTGDKLAYNISTATSASDSFVKNFDNSTDYYNCALVCASGDYDYTSNGKLDVGNTTLARVYALSQIQVVDFARWLWTDDIADNLVKWFSDPMEAVMGLMVFPFNIFSHMTVDTDYKAGRTVVVGNLPVSLGSGTHLTAPVMKNTVVTLDLGYIPISRNFNDFRDYPPYTTLKLWLPYIGYIDISPAEFYVTGRIYVQYRVNIITGFTVVSLATSSDTINTPHMTVNGQIGESVPLSQTAICDLQRRLTMGVVDAALTVIGGVAISKATSNFTSEVSHKQYESGNTRRLAEKSVDTYESSSSASPSYAVQSVARGASTFVNSVMQPNGVEGRYSLSGNVFRDMSQKPYLYIYRTNAIDEAGQLAKYGKLVMESHTLTGLSGYCKVNDPNLPMKGMQGAVHEELVRILSSGFYIE